MRDREMIVALLAHDDALLTPGEVATIFRVDAKTVTRWAKTIDPMTDKPRIASIRTPGGHRRYPATEVRRLLDGESAAA